eukprot:gnl/Trimastix_PCT/3366.p2 GENE.gnl/Trimastix_PCT/3366~~gnl/Trimastix_PCT/3366.p2  ORF type:complete len:171 (-),score=30.39 gnl/Trimastix_PCT/3366:926-1438(-)
MRSNSSDRHHNQTPPNLVYQPERFWTRDDLVAIRPLFYDMADDQPKGAKPVVVNPNIPAGLSSLLCKLIDDFLHDRLTARAGVHALCYLGVYKRNIGQPITLRQLQHSYGAACIVAADYVDGVNVPASVWERYHAREFLETLGGEHKRFLLQPEDEFAVYWSIAQWDKQL